MTRVGPVVVLVWIGGLKIFRYEDEGIVPFVANSPFMSFFYRQPAGEYRRHMNREGEKDAIMMGEGMVTTADSAKAYLRCRHAVPGSTTCREEAALRRLNNAQGDPGTPARRLKNKEQRENLQE